MSDLQCPATLLIARHGDAAYDDDTVLNDDGGWLTALGREQVTTLAASLASERIAAVHSSTMNRAVESATLAAEHLGLTAEALEGLQEYSVGDLAGLPDTDPRLHDTYDRWMGGELDARVPGGETGHEVVRRVSDALESLADRYRGETVLVFTHGGVMSLVLPLLARNARNDLARRKYLPNAVPATVRVDADGWVIDVCPGSESWQVV